MDAVNIPFPKKRTPRETHSQERIPDLKLVISAQIWVDIEHSTHLTINKGFNVQTGSTKYHAQETSHARERVNLLIGQINPETPVMHLLLRTHILNRWGRWPRITLHS